MDYLYKFLFVCLFNISLFYKYNHLSYFNSFNEFIIDTIPLTFIFILGYFGDLLRNSFKNIFQKYFIYYDNFENILVTITVLSVYHLGIINMNYFLIESNNINNLTNNITYSILLMYLSVLLISKKSIYNRITYLIFTYFIVYQYIYPSVTKILIKNKFDLLLYLNLKISLFVFINQILSNISKYYYPSWENNNLISFGDKYLWTVYTFLSYFVLETFDPKICTGYFIITFQIIQHPNNINKQFRSIPNQIICIFIDCYNKYLNEYNIRETQKQINNMEYLAYNKKYNKNVCSDLLYKNNWSLKKYFQLKTSDILYIKKNHEIPHNCICLKIYNNDNTIFSINTSKIDGEINDKYKKIYNNDNNNNNNNNIHIGNLNYKTNNYLIPKGAITNTDIITQIININIKNSKVRDFVSLYKKYLTSIEILFIIINISLVCIFSLLYYISYGNINKYLIIQILMNTQMINPMIMNTILLFVNNSINYYNIQLNSKYNLLSFYIPNNNKIHFTDKTGTLTQNKLSFYGFAKKHKNKWNMVDENDIYDIIKIFVGNTLNSINNCGFVPEEKAVFQHYNIDWLSYKNYNNLLFKQIQYKNKTINTTSINLGIDNILKGSISIIYEKNKYIFTIQCSTDLFSKLNNVNIKIINLNQKYIDINDIIELDNLCNINGAPRYWCLLKSNSINLTTETLDNIKHIATESSNNNFIINKKHHHYLISLLTKCKFEFLGVELIKDLYMDNADDILDFNKRKNIQTAIITGDNKNNAFLIAEHLNFCQYKSYILLNITEFKNLIYNDNSSLYNKNLIFYGCTPEEKLEIVVYFKNLNFSIIYSGDGMNDIPAMNKSDFVIGFPDSSSKNNIINPNVKLVSDIEVKPNFWDDYTQNKLYYYADVLKACNINTIFLILMKQSLLAGLFTGSFLINRFISFDDPFSFYFYQLYMMLSVILSSKYCMYENTYFKFLFNYADKYIFSSRIEILKNFLKYYFTSIFISFINYYTLNISMDYLLFVVLIIQFFN